MELETNFQQVQSQLDAVLLFQEVCSNEFIAVHPYRSVLFIATVLQDVSPEAESQQELLDERDKLKNRVGHLEAALSAALSERQRLMVGPSYILLVCLTASRRFRSSCLILDFLQDSLAQAETLSTSIESSGAENSICAQSCADGEMSTLLRAANEEVRNLNPLHYTEQHSARALI